jgi:divalent metal cation (Fe/Co/Zn/Cd) transporter
MDSTGGILLSLFVLSSWARNAVENAKMIMGQAAPPEIIRNLTYVPAHHHPVIKVVACQLGPMYFAKVFVVLRDGISFEAARWIGDTLSLRLTLVPDIEHAYVHLDTPSHDLKLEKLLKLGAKHGMKYARDARTGQIVFNVSDDPQTV